MFHDVKSDCGTPCVNYNVKKVRFEDTIEIQHQN